MSKGPEVALIVGCGRSVSASYARRFEADKMGLAVAARNTKKTITKAPSRLQSVSLST